MAGLSTLARWEFLILVGGFLGIVLYKVCTGAIRLSGLLIGDRADGTSGLSPGRIQLLGITTFSALYYFIEVIRDLTVTTLPDLPPVLLGALGVSQATYLGCKAWSLLINKNIFN